MSRPRYRASDMPSRSAPKIALVPESAPSWMADAIRAGGGQLVSTDKAEGLIWGTATDSTELGALLEISPNIGWVQLPYAGVENFIHLIDEKRRWTCGKGVFAEPTAELALSLALAGMRGVAHYARMHGWSGPRGDSLQGGRVTIVGGGGVAEALLALLVPFRCHVTVVRNRVEEMTSADDVVESDRLSDVLPGADLVVLALSLTPETEGIISMSELEMMEEHAWLVNVARGKHVVTDDLVVALSERVIGGAALDVTDPEPLPDTHPLWTMPNCLITPHVGNTPEMAIPLLGKRIEENVRRYGAGRELIGEVDPELGY
jgi:phosphoglycerate dehydrogenase-like enzyme